jgi:hypothetical protein
VAGPFDDILIDVKQNALEKWDYSSLFPPSNLDGTPYTFPRGPIYLSGWPFQVEKQLMAVKNSQLTQPVISMYLLPFADEDRTFGDVYTTGTGSGPLQLRLGRRANPTIQVSCWADQQLGGMDMARKLAGHVFSAMFYYRNRLTTMRGLRMTHSQEAFTDTAQLYRYEMSITGRSLVVIDV